MSPGNGVISVCPRFPLRAKARPPARLDIGGDVRRIVPELFHERSVDRSGVDGKHIDEGAVGGVADGAFFVGVSSLGRGASQSVVKLRSDGAIVVGCPGVVHASVDDGQGTGYHGRAEFGVADTLQGRVVPLNYDIRFS